MDLDRTLRSTRAYRRRLDLSRPVDRAVIAECLDLAVHAPSGSDRRAWQFIAIDDADVRAQIGALYLRGFEENLAGRRLAASPDLDSARYLALHLADVPVLVLACQAGRPPVDSQAKLASFYGSIIPAIWSFQLALRSRGLGSTFTTAHLRYEREVAEILGIPFDEVAQIALIPVAHLLGDPPAPSPRGAGEVTHWNGWGS